MKDDQEATRRRFRVIAGGQNLPAPTKAVSNRGAEIGLRLVSAVAGSCVRPRPPPSGDSCDIAYCLTFLWQRVRGTRLPLGFTNAAPLGSGHPLGLLHSARRPSAPVVEGRVTSPIPTQHVVPYAQISARPLCALHADDGPAPAFWSSLVARDQARRLSTDRTKAWRTGQALRPPRQ
jgi:hypothetical protein